MGLSDPGGVEPDTVFALVDWAHGLGVRSIMFGDTTGMADPRGVTQLFTAAVASGPTSTSRRPLLNRGVGSNTLAAIEAGVRTVDASLGVGGEPSAVDQGDVGESGNVVTEDLVAALQQMDVPTGIDLEALLRAGRLAEDVLGRPSTAGSSDPGRATDGRAPPMGRIDSVQDGIAVVVLDNRPTERRGRRDAGGADGGLHAHPGRRHPRRGDPRRRRQGVQLWWRHRRRRTARWPEPVVRRCPSPWPIWKPFIAAIQGTPSVAAPLPSPATCVWSAAVRGWVPPGLWRGAVGARRASASPG